VVVAHVLFVDGGVVPATFQFNLAPFYLSCKMCVCVYESIFYTTVLTSLLYISSLFRSPNITDICKMCVFFYRREKRKLEGTADLEWRSVNGEPNVA